MVKKVLFISPLPPPHYGSALSSEMCLNILRGSRDFEVRSIKLNYSRKMNDLGKINFDKIIGIFKVKNQIKKEIKNFKPDIVYFMPATSSLGLLRDAYFIKQIKKIWKGKILFHIRARILEEDWKNKRKRKILSGMLKDQKAIVLGEELVRDLHGLIKNENIFILPNAIKNDVSDKQLKEILKERKKNKQLEILFISNMDRTKGWPKLLEACKILDKKNINFRCGFVGAWQSKKDKEYFENFVKRNNLQNKVFSLGKKIGKEKRKILEKTDVLVFPTEYKLETFGRVILEAYMFMVPVIANGIATILSTVKHGKTGFVLKENNPKEISRYLEKLQDIKLREKIGKAGRKRFLDNFELENYKKEFKWILK